MRRLRAVTSVALAILLACGAGCLDSNGPGRTVSNNDNLPGLVVSTPVSGAAVRSGSVKPLISGSPAGDGIVYVSLLPGSVPLGLRATIGDRAMGSLATASLVDGGFDPTPILANVGDTLLIDITVPGSGTPVHGMQVVEAYRPPVVVRTIPAPKKVDVPLNSLILVVFSTPIDSTTLNTGSVQLWRDTTPVTGTVRSTDSTGLRVEFRPASLLAPHTNYRLLITQAIHDLNGVAPDSSTDVEFTTGETVQVAAQLALLIKPGTVGVGQPFAVQVAIEDSLGGWVRSSAESVTLSLGANPGGATLAGTRTVPAILGVASFGNLSLDRAASGYTLVASSGTLAEATSGPFTVLQSAAGLVFSSVSAGFSHSCGVTADGNAYCWGDNARGQLGDSTNVSSTTPVRVVGGLTFTSVSAGYITTCGVTATGAAYCWGSSPYLGIDSAAAVNSCTFSTGCPMPLPVAGGHTFAMVSVGDYHTCGVTTNGAAYCWGDGADGETGTNYFDALNGPWTPVAVAGGHTFATVSAGYHHSCGVATDGSAFCWGDNAWGQLGAGISGGPQCPNTNYFYCSFIPVPVSGGLTFTGVSAGEGFSCGVTETGAAYCWGSNQYGLGTGSTAGPEVCVYDSYGDSAPCSTSPVAVAGGLRFSMASVKYPACGVTTDGTVYCWADYFGKVEKLPGVVPGGLSFASLSSGYGHICGMTKDGVAYCWGGNNGELGDGTTTNSDIPVKVAGQP